MNYDLYDLLISMIFSRQQLTPDAWFYLHI